MNKDILVGLFLSIPIGIITSLITPHVQKLNQIISQKARIKANNITKKEYEILKKYYENKTELSLFLISTIIKTTFISAFMSILSYIFFISSLILYPIINYVDINYLFNVHLILPAIGQTVLLIGSILIVNICKSAVNVWKKIKNFDEYERVLRAKKLIK
jgi:hypothetical protein